MIESEKSMLGNVGNLIITIIKLFSEHYAEELFKATENFHIRSLPFHFYTVRAIDASDNPDLQNWDNRSVIIACNDLNRICLNNMGHFIYPLPNGNCVFLNPEDVASVFACFRVYDLANVFTPKNIDALDDEFCDEIATD